MTAEQQRIAIAGLMGIPELNECPCCHLYRGQGHDSFCTYIPNYPASLDACAEFEKTLSGDEITDYINQIYRVTFKACRADRDEGVVFATAPQRCEAFLRTKNLWTDQ